MELAREIREDQKLVEAYLQAYSESMEKFGVLQDAMAYSLMAGGKRIRPVLTLEFCRLFGGEPEKALPFACGLELLHTSSLIHDDLPCMDDDDFRRGKPTSHKVYGEAMAVLAGDALLIAAFELLTKADLAPEQIARAVRCLSRAAGPEGMVAGQVLDLEGEEKTLSYDEVVRMESLKTGCMIEAAARLGCIAAGSSEAEEENAAQYARKIGLAFQIQDDILDLTADEEELGKPIGSDVGNNKSTFVSLKGLDQCRALVEQLTKEAVEHIQSYPGSGTLCDFAQNLAVRRK